MRERERERERESKLEARGEEIMRSRDSAVVRADPVWREPG